MYECQISAVLIGVFGVVLFWFGFTKLEGFKFQSVVMFISVVAMVIGVMFFNFCGVMADF